MLNTFAKLIEQRFDFFDIGRMATYKAKQLAFFGRANTAAYRALKVDSANRIGPQSHFFGFGGLDGAHVNEDLLANVAREQTIRTRIHVV